MKWQILTLLLLSVSWVHSPLYALEVQTFTSQDEVPKALDLHQFKSPEKLKPLAQLKWFETKSQWNNCVELAGELQGEVSLGIWVKHTYLKCLHSLAKSQKISGKKITQAYLSFKGQEDILNSPFFGHREQLLNTYLRVLRAAVEKSSDDLQGLITSGASLLDFMDTNQRSQFYHYLGEVALSKKQTDVALSNFLRSQALSPSATVQKRLEELGHKEDKRAGTQKFQDGPGELKAWGQFHKAMQKGQSLQVASRGVDFLNQFPGSHRSQRVEEGINTFFKRILFLRGSKNRALKKDFEETLMRAPPASLLTWATEAYKRGYQDSTFRLASEAAHGWQASPDAPRALILAARSAYYISQRKRAQDFLQTILNKHSGHELVGEASYLLGLLYYREKVYDKLIPLYSDFLESEASDRWELQVRYWLWRAMLKTDDKRHRALAQSILKKFPLTYYGLVVRMEADGGLQSLWAENPKEEIRYAQWWPERNSKRFERISQLLTHGWVKEAEAEILYLPDPHTAMGYLFRAKLWEGAGLLTRALQDYSSALHLDENLFSKDILVASFPRLYKNDVEKSQKEFGVEKSLIWAVMRQESAFMPRAVSPSRAYGLMQMLKPTARETARWLRVRNFNADRDIFDPATNIRFGTHFLSRMLKKYKTLAPLAVASYNVGPGNLDRWLSYRTDFVWEKVGESFDDDIWADELPWSETSYYVKAVMRNHLLYQVIHEGRDKLAAPAWESPDQDSQERLPSDEETS